MFKKLIIMIILQNLYKKIFYNILKNYSKEINKLVLTFIVRTIIFFKYIKIFNV